MNALTLAAAALRTRDARFPWVGPTVDEAEVADVLAELGALHDETGTSCVGCGEQAPCRGWVHGHQLAVQWLGYATDRVLSGHFSKPARPPAQCCPELLCRHVSRTATSYRRTA